MHCNMLTNCAD